MRDFSRRTFVTTSAAIGAGATVCGLARTPAAAAATPTVPTLPQYDSPTAALVRRARLSGKQLEYVWTTHAPNLSGVPMAAWVPLDEQPTLEWLLLAVERGIDLFINLLGSIIPQFDASLDAALIPQQTQLKNLKASTAQLRKQYDALAVANAGRTGVDPITQGKLTAIRTSLGVTTAQLATIRGSLITTLSADLLAGKGIGDFGNPDGLARFNAMWSTMPIPSVEQNVHDDAVFARLRVAGANPMVIQRVTGALPTKFTLSDADYQQVMAGDSLSAAIAERRLYLADYAPLGAMAPAHATYKALTGNGYNSAPIALFAVPQGGGSLQAVAIQCGQDAGTTMVLRPKPDDSAHYWGWQMAKTVVQTADFNHHEMIVHLARTHLVSEAFCVATHRHLAPTHPLNVLLSPHFEGDLFINELAALIIMAPNTFGDIILAAPISDLQQGAGQARLSWDFYGNMPHAEFAARGVDDTTALPDYPYRDDSLLVWDALRGWVTDYLRVYYASDADVTGDTELAAWANELIAVGKVKGFRRITTRAQLIDVVTMVIFTASAQHAAVNYPQADLMTYAPFSAGMTSTPPPTSATGHTEADWIKQLPPVFAGLAQMYFLNLLGGVFYRPLGDYRTNDFPYSPALTDPRISSPLSNFQSALRGVEQTIAGRNATRAEPYEYLLPSRIPTSTNI
ncbi:lipoxygenase family protein [Flexivirga meconopsidis]|uniref:lipoxygenase family protein n=1 Tax=Flexivirga meconopsidis TaxID=2977121 RepID=UPI00223ECF3D|nr:lipoxygenase family protein [Flexivirga meconopsidis]